MNDAPKKTVTRFAPSPTGYMHVGGIRTALFAWAFARQQGGTFILRIEDTDKEREVEGSIEQIIDSLKWIGIDWDEGPDKGGPHAPYLQSERLESYKKYAKILMNKGLAYADPYTAEELEAFRKKADEEKRPFLYRDHRPENPPAWDGSAALRFKTPRIISYEWNDLARGDLKAGPEALDDFILIKSDGYPTYNFAHIIDDLEMGVTHIVRGDEFISSTPKFLSVYEALGIERPQFVSLAPIMAPDGKKKLGKRDGAKDALGYKEDGYLSEAMMNFLAFIGWNPGDEREIMKPEEFIRSFSFSGVQHSGGKFNPEKLLWTNKEHLKLLSDAEFADGIRPFISEEIRALPHFDAVFAKIIPELRDRVSVYSEIRDMEAAGELGYFFSAPSYAPELLLCSEKQRKGRDVALSGLAPIFSKLREIIDAAEDGFNAEYIKTLVWPYADAEGRGIVLWAMRTALSGKEKSPDPFSLAAILGKEETSLRLAKAEKMVG